MGSGFTAVTPSAYPPRAHGHDPAVAGSGGALDNLVVTAAKLAATLDLSAKTLTYRSIVNADLASNAAIAKSKISTSGAWVLAELPEKLDLFQMPPVASYKGVNITYATLTTGSVGANYLLASPIITQQKTTFDQIGLYVSTLGAGLCRLGIYNDNGSWYPSTLVLDAGTVDVSSTGLKTVTISQQLDRGIYWLVLVSNIAFSLYVSAYGIPLFDNGGTGSTRGYSISFTYAALPSTFPSGATSAGNSLDIILRVGSIP